MDKLADALAALTRGDIVCTPTETSYGLAVDVRNQQALDRLSTLKGRADDTPFALIAADIEQVRRLVRSWPNTAQKLAAEYWPGPLTLVLPARPGLSAAILGPSGGVGVRISSHPLPVALARELGSPITATSANPSGSPPATNIADARGYFGDRVACYLDAGPAPGERPSTVAAIAPDGRVRVLRPGPVDVS